MRINGLIWLGTRTENFGEMVAFVERVLGLPAGEQESGLAQYELSDGSFFEVFAPSHHGGGHPPRGVVAGFEVEDVAEARRELVSAGAEVSELREADSWRWAYFRAPDGNLYEIAQRD